MPYQVVTFDVYSALFDIESSLTGRVADALGTTVGAGSLVQAWRRTQMHYALISNALGMGRVPFRLVTRRALDLTLGQTGDELDHAGREALVQAWDELEPWPEATAVLKAVRQGGHRIAILSNGDQSMLEALAERLDISFDAIYSAEAAGAYKPNPAIYQLPCDDLGIAQSEILHVAGSPTDVMGAKSAGLPCAWSNRRGDHLLDPSLAPDFTFPNLRGLLDVL
ncbi:MAG: haloacid dehalogenase type II [Anaerolineales bacterium]